MAANQVGKTIAGAYEMAMHLTGVYPEWWQGRRFVEPINAWAAGVTGESTRDNPQRVLLGRPGKLGTGSIPAELIEKVTSARGIPDAVDSVRVRHVSGGISVLSFKSYEKGREKWQGETLEIVWFDEEPPSDIYTEGLTRTNATNGMVFITFTPLQGMSDVVMRFVGSSKLSTTHVTTMTVDEAEHYSKEDIERITASYLPHEREARLKGVPSLGSGRIFAIPEADIVCSMPEIKPHWPRIAGLDFGWDHPTAAAWLAWDRDLDIVYVYDTFRESETTPIQQVPKLRTKGPWIPFAWPHDGLQHDKGSGEQLAKQYGDAGLNTLPSRATFVDGSNGVEAGLFEMLQRMQTGRLKVVSTLSDWLEEFRLYHRKDGKIVKEKDDLISATRYAMMMLRFSRVQEEKQVVSFDLPPGQMGL